MHILIYFCSPLFFCFCREFTFDPSDEAGLTKELTLQVRKVIGPFAAPKQVYIVPDLPKTRSGKVCVIPSSSFLFFFPPPRPQRRPVTLSWPILTSSTDPIPSLCTCFCRSCAVSCVKSSRAKVTNLAISVRSRTPPSSMSSRPRSPANKSPCHRQPIPILIVVICLKRILYTHHIRIFADIGLGEGGRVVRRLLAA